jgi:hypothetical protein
VTDDADRTEESAEHEAIRAEVRAWLAAHGGLRGRELREAVIDDG